MTDQTPFERRLTALLGRLADRVGTDVDPMAVTRLAAVGAQGERLRWSRTVQVPQGWAWIALVLALAAAFVGGLLIGGPGRSGPIVSASPSPTASTTASNLLAKSTVIAQYQRFHAGYVYVYGDGLVLSLNDNNGPWVLMERRLTREGVNLVRSGAVAASAFLVVPTQLPDGSWENPESRPYQSSKHAICYWTGEGYVDAESVQRVLPVPAQDWLRGKERTYTSEGLQRVEVDCSEVTTDEAGVLAWILESAGFEVARGRDGGFSASILVPAQGGAEAYELVVGQSMILPHGTWVAWGA